MYGLECICRYYLKRTPSNGLIQYKNHQEEKMLQLDHRIDSKIRICVDLDQSVLSTSHQFLHGHVICERKLSSINVDWTIDFWRKGPERNWNKNFTYCSWSLHVGTILVPPLNIYCSQFASNLREIQPKKTRNSGRERKDREQRKEILYYNGWLHKIRVWWHIWMEWSSLNVHTPLHSDHSRNRCASFLLPNSSHLLYPHS